MNVISELLTVYEKLLLMKTKNKLIEVLKK